MSAINLVERTANGYGINTEVALKLIGAHSTNDFGKFSRKMMKNVFRRLSEFRTDNPHHVESFWRVRRFLLQKTQRLYSEDVEVFNWYVNKYGDESPFMDDGIRLKDLFRWVLTEKGYRTLTFDDRHFVLRNIASNDPYVLHSILSHVITFVFFRIIVKMLKCHTQGITFMRLVDGVPLGCVNRISQFQQCFRDCLENGLPYEPTRLPADEELKAVEIESQR